MSNLRIGVVGIPGKWSTEALADAIEARTGFRLVIDMADVELQLGSNRLLYRGQDLTELDALVVKKISEIYTPHTLDRIELLRHAERAGVRVFSPTRSLMQLIDRLSGTLSLSAAGIPMPLTRVTESLEAAEQAVHEFGAAVLKPLYSTKARGMTLVEADDTSLSTQLADFAAGNPMLYIQKKLDLSGRDLGMVFVGGQYLCTYARVGSQDAWNTTIHSGGRYEPFEPDAELIELGRKAQACFDLDFTTVDIALTDTGPVVFEVSAFGGFRGALEGCGIDAAAAYLDWIMQTLETTRTC